MYENEELSKQYHEYQKPINLHASTLVIKCISKLMDMLGKMMTKCLD